MFIPSLSCWESDVYWRQHNRHFAELAPQNGGKQLIWRNYVTVTLCVTATMTRRPAAAIYDMQVRRSFCRHEAFRYIGENYTIWTWLWTRVVSFIYLFIMAALCNRGPLYFCPVVSFYLLLSFFFIPRLISAATDWMSTILPHMAWP